MRKVTRKSLDELAKIMPVISEENQKMYVGGTSGSTGTIPPSGSVSTDGGWTPPPPTSPLGSSGNPYSVDEALGLMDAGNWGGGYVSGWGYVSPEVKVDSPTGYVPPTSPDNNTGGYDNGPSGYNGGYNGGTVDDFSGGFLGDGSTSGNDSISGGSLGDGSIGNNGFVGGGFVSGGGGSAGGGGYVSGGGSAGGGSTGNNDSLYDGIDIQNAKNFTFNTESQSAFNEQLMKILRSNSVIKNLLNYFDKGYVHLTFDIENLDKTMTAYTQHVTNESYHISFNSQYMTEQGWNAPLNRIDNIGYDWSKVKTKDEGLLVTLTHEAIHAKHYATFYDAFIQAGEIKYNTCHILQEKGYS